MTISFEQLVDLIELAIIVIAFIFLYKSVPADKVAELREKAGNLAGKTPTPADDILLQIYDYIQVVSGAKPVSEETSEERPRD